jgi:ParB-like chromosome segregation protein Spo0J
MPAVAAHLKVVPEPVEPVASDPVVSEPVVSSKPSEMFPALGSATEAALRASIERFGVLVPVIHNQHGHTLDGHHRERIAPELGVLCESRTVFTDDDDHAREIARTLNEDRRQLLDIEHRRQVVGVLREEGHSQRAIAGALGVSKRTVAKDLDQLGTRTQLTAPDRITGLDGKSRPAKRKASKPEPAPVPESEDDARERYCFHTTIHIYHSELSAQQARARAERWAKKITGADITNHTTEAG